MIDASLVLYFRLPCIELGKKIRLIEVTCLHFKVIAYVN